MRSSTRARPSARSPEALISQIIADPRFAKPVPGQITPNKSYVLRNGNFKTHNFVRRHSSKETKSQSRLYLTALLMLAATALLSTVTTAGNNVFAQDDSEENSNRNSDNVVDNGNAGEGGNCDTQPDRVGSHDKQTSGEGANPGGTVTDETIPCESRDNQEGCVGEASDDTVTANCFGKVISHEAQEQK